MNNVLQGVLVLDTATSLKLKKEGKVEDYDGISAREIVESKKISLVVRR